VNQRAIWKETEKLYSGLQTAEWEEGENIV
jgi:hypothetical protein